MPLREASITLPQGNEFLDKRLTTELCASFGGCSIFPGHGAWIAPNGECISEPINRFVVGVDAEDHTANQRIFRYAVQFGHLAKQQAMYVTYSDGNAEVIDMSSLEREAA